MLPKGPLVLYTASPCPLDYPAMLSPSLTLPYSLPELCTHCGNIFGLALIAMIVRLRLRSPLEGIRVSFTVSHIDNHSQES
jgi:hypothetical protein